MDPLSEVKQRYLFIDLYRSAVIFFMLEGHLLRVLLEPHIQRSGVFQFHELFHGISAPAFLFGTGLTFVISTKTRWEDYHHWGLPLVRRLRRIFLILLLGLGLHLPYFSFRKIVLEGTTADYLRLFQSDVLACIGLGLLALHGVIFFFKKENRFYSLVLVMTLAICFSTPIVWDIDFLKYLPVALAQLFNSIHGSPFPLFPFVGFLLVGVIISWEFGVFAGQQRERFFMQRMIVFGIFLIVAGIAIDMIPIQIYPTYNFWYTSPNYFFIRVGALMIMTSAFWYLANRLTPARTTQSARGLAGKSGWSNGILLKVFGKESLFVYVLHLIVLYGSVLNPRLNLRTMVGENVGILESAWILLLFTMSMLVTALLWNYIKEKHVNIYRLIQLAGSGVFLYLFFTRDY